MSTKIMDCDLVVLGAGGSGLVAAVKAAELSGKKVIVLEKANKIGGASIFAHAISVMDSKWQKEAGVTVSEPQDISGQFFDWLVEKGGAEKYFIVAKNGERMFGSYRFGQILMPKRQEKYRNHPDPSIGPGWVGSYIVDKMVECCEKMGIPILTETRARKFITDDKGRVTGVLADTKDGQLLINCKACFIGAGGFGADMEKLKKRWPEVYNNKEIFSLCPPALTGDGIDMAEEIGAAVDQTKRDTGDGFVNAGLTHHPYSYTIYRMMAEPEMVIVNLNGKRLSNRATLADEPKAVAYAIADNDVVEMLGEMRIVNYHEDADIPILKKFRDDIAYEVALDEAGVKGNRTKKADTLAELAVKMDINPSAFVATIERYNKFCDDGKDLDFGKDPKSLKPVRKPPFYAFFGHRHTQCTKGRNGIAVNSKYEVLNAKGEAMPGLWAGGDACTIYGAVRRRFPGGPSAAAGAAAGAAGGAPGGAAPGGAQGGAPSGVAGAAVGAPGIGGSVGVAGSTPSGGAAGASGTASGGVPPGPAASIGAPGASSGAPGGITAGSAGGVPGASSASANILSTEGFPNGGLGSAVLSGYQAGINLADYLKNI